MDINHHQNTQKCEEFDIKSLFLRKYKFLYKLQLLWSDSPLGFSVKLKLCLNGYGEFTFWWIQFALVLPCDRSNLDLAVSRKVQ